MMAKLTGFKREAIEQTVISVRDQIGCSLMEAVSKMQATAARNGNEALLEDLCEYKSELIAAL